MKTVIEEVSRITSDGLSQSNLVIKFSKSYTSIVNSFRRMALDHIPTYAFPIGLINITKNTSIFNNDYMQLRLSQLTPQNINVPVEFLDYKYWDIDYDNVTSHEKHPDDNLNIELYINAVNNTNDILNVTTNDIDMFINGDKINEFNKKYPQLLIQLKPKQEFNCSMTTMLGIGKKNNIFASCGCAYLEELDDGVTILTLESQGQMTEKEVLIRSCRVMKKKIEYLIEYFQDTLKDEKMLEIDLSSEDHTIGNVINELLQDHEDIIFSGICKPDFLVDEVRIKVQSKTNIKNPMDNVLKDIIKLYSDLEKQFQKLK